MTKSNNPFRPRSGDSTGFDQELEFPVLISERKTRIYRIFVDNFISSPQDFRWAVHCWAEATEDDEVYLQLSSPGGSVDGMLALLQAKNNSRALTHVVASGTIASAAAIILADSESYELDSFASVLFHSVSFGVGGKSIDNVEYSNFVHEHSKKLLEFYTIGCLTPSELNEIVQNKKEFWLSASDFAKRMQRKARCRSLVLQMVKDQGIDTETADTETYVELMTLALRIDEENQSKASPKKRTSRAKKPSPPASCNNSCC